MLTNLLYYGYYRPYILSENGNKKVKISSKTIQNSLKTEEASYFLNKSFKDDVKSYIKNISTSFNTLKSNTNYLALKLNKNFEIQENIQNSANAIYNFSNGYNSWVEIFNNDINIRQNFNGYLSSIQKILNDNSEVFEEAGVDIKDGTFLTLDTDFNEKFFNCNEVTLNRLKYVCSSIYERTCEVMQQPLTNYMNFKDFSYYFNYSVYNSSQKTFGLVESGVLFDIGI